MNKCKKIAKNKIFKIKSFSLIIKKVYSMGFLTSFNSLIKYF